MADRRNSGYARKPRDLYCTPAWVTEELLKHVHLNPVIWEPACGEGHMERVLVKAGFRVLASDIEPGLGSSGETVDFLAPGAYVADGRYAGSIVTNPPFGHSERFAELAISRMKSCGGQVCLLLPTDWDHAACRTHLFTNGIFARKIVLTKRISWFKGTSEDKGKQPMGNHAWFVWDWRHYGPPAISYMMPSAEPAAARRKPRKVLAAQIAA